MLAWALNKINDSVGNYLELDYFEDNTNGEYYVTHIAYTGNTTEGMLPNNSVDFIYGSRTDTSSGYIAGAAIRNSVRLSNIQISSGAQVIRNYALSYQAGSTTGRSQLKEIKQCAGIDAGAECLPVTSLTWSAGEASFGAKVSVGNSTGYENTRVLDVNDDGVTDLTYCKAATSEGTEKWSVLVSNKNSFNAAYTTATGCGLGYGEAIVGNYYGGVNMDIFVPYRIKYAYSGVYEGTWGLPLDYDSIGVTPSESDFDPLIMDVNGDDYDDLIQKEDDGQLYLYINDPRHVYGQSGFLPAVATGIYPALFGSTTNTNSWQYHLKIDYDGDGMMDVLLPNPANNHWYVYRSTGSNQKVVWNGTAYVLTDTITLESIDTGISVTGYDAYPQVMDLNGDGYQDLLVNANGVKTAYLNRGNGLQSAGTWSTGTQWTDKTYQLDYNGDGKVDLIMPGSPSSATASNWYVLQSKTAGTGFTVINTGIASTGYNTYPQVGDFNGDGYADLVLSYSNSRYLMLHNAGTPDQLSSIVNGLGDVIEVTYKPLTDANVYSKTSESSSQASIIQVPLYVTSDVSISNGVGGSNVSHYTYTGARYEVGGKGFLGFDRVTMVDEQSQLSTQTEYNLTFPFIGMVESVETRLVDSSVLIKKVDYTLSSASPVSSNVDQVYVTSYETTYELDGTLITGVYNGASTSNHDDFGNPTTVGSSISKGGGTTHYKATYNTYDDDVTQWYLGRLTSTTVTSTSPTGAQTRSSAFEYSPTSGLLTAEIIEPFDPQFMLRTEYTYDGFGNKTSVKVMDSGSNTYPITTATSYTAYDYAQLAANGTYSIISTNAKSHTETQIIDAKFGLPLSLTGPNGLTTQWQYDNFGRQTAEIRADGTATNIVYTWCDSNCAGVANAVYKVTSQASGAAPVSVYFDSLGRELRSESLGLDGSGGGSDAIYKDTEYNNLGQVTRVSRPYFIGDTPKWTDYLYDMLGRVWKETAPDGGITETAYNGLTTSTRRYSVNDPYDQTTTRITDVEGNLVQVIDAGSQTTQYEYDPFGNLTRVTDPANNAIVMAYDLRGRKISMDDPDMGHWEYQYDALGQLRGQKDAKNQSLTMSYDTLGRMTGRIAPEGTSTWTYDQPGTKGIGKPWKVVGPDGYSETYTYDLLGRPSRTTQVLSGSSFNTTSSYDSFGRLDTLIYPNGFQLRHSYNAQGDLETVSNAANASTVYWQMKSQSADGQVNSAHLGNGLDTVQSIDPASGRTTYIGTYGSTNVQMLTYQYDALGNLKSRADAVQTLSETFQYDDYNRLTNTTIDGVGSKIWSYDGLGNLTAKDGYTDYAYGSAGAQPHAVTAARGKIYSYDANGNMASGAGRTITWNSANLPTRITKGGNSADFSYAPDGTRYKQVAVSGGVSRTVLYVGKLYEQITKSGVTTHKNYIYAAGRVVAIRESVNSAVTMKYLHQDHLGSTDVVTGDSAQILERQSFDAFGTRRVANTWNAPPPLTSLASSILSRGFTGHEQIDDVDLIHMNGRVYDPALGRFISADPIVQAPGNAQSLNRYSYVGNNPLSRIDPSGYGWLSSAWNSITNAVKDVVSTVVNVVKKVISNPIVQAVAAIVVAPWAGLYIGTTLGVSTAAGYAISGFTAGFIASGGSLQAGALGSIAALGFYGVGSLGWGSGSTALAHGTVGGTTNALAGGSFKDGFVSGGFTSLASPRIGVVPGGAVGRTVAAAVVGGTASELGGGKFANGAVTGAFSRLYNDEAHEKADREYALTKTFEKKLGLTVNVGSVAVIENSKWASFLSGITSIRTGGAMYNPATTQIDTIYLHPTVSAESFYSQPELMLHEYYHVFDQWNNGRMNNATYLSNSGKWEDEAETFASKNVGTYQFFMGN